MAGFNTNIRSGQKSQDSHAAARSRAGRARKRQAPRGAAAAAASGMELLESRVLMSAVRPDAAFSAVNLGLGDDRSFPTTGSIGYSLGFSAPINFFGSLYSGVFVNNNGNISLGARNSFYTNVDLDSLNARVIAPFYANVDTRFSGSTVKYGQGTIDGRRAFGVNWLNVDYQPSNAAHTNRNSFQLVLIDRSDLGAGDFDIEFNYDQIRWESGGSSGGDADGLGGSSARIGWHANNGSLDGIFQMDGSNVAGSFLDSNDISGLVHNSFMSDVDGRYVFRFRGGTWADAPGSGEVNHVPIVTLPEGGELVESADGTTPLSLAGLFDDPDADNWTATVDYGDGTGTQLLQLSGHDFALEHTYGQPGLYTVTVTVDDGKGGVGVGTTSFAVQDRSAPVVDVVVPQLVREGETVMLAASMANDLDLNDTYTFDWYGDGVADGSTFAFTAADNGTYTVRLVVSDQHGNSTVMDVPIGVENVAPTATGFSGSNAVNEGSSFTLGLDGAGDASPVDMASGLLYSFDFDGDGVFEVSGGSASASHVFRNDGVYVVTGRVTDKDGGYTDYSTHVEVYNVDPVVTAVSNSAASLGSATAGSTVSVGASFTDAGVLDGHTAFIDWGDGTSDMLAAPSADGLGSTSGSHVYAQGGIYTVTLTVRDDAQSAGVATVTTQVFVTGVGLHNGILQIVGTNGDDRVRVSADKQGMIRVQSNLVRDVVFSGTSVREIHATLGLGRDAFDATTNVTQPIYLNGVRYYPQKGRDPVAGSITRTVFSDRLVA